MMQQMNFLWSKYHGLYINCGTVNQVLQQAGWLLDEVLLNVEILYAGYFLHLTKVHMYSVIIAILVYFFE